MKPSSLPTFTSQPCASSRTRRTLGSRSGVDSASFKVFGSHFCLRAGSTSYTDSAAPLDFCINILYHHVGCMMLMHWMLRPHFHRIVTRRPSVFHGLSKQNTTERWIFQELGKILPFHWALCLISTIPPVTCPCQKLSMSPARFRDRSVRLRKTIRGKKREPYFARRRK
jgi:hypothetical protein